MVRAVSDRGHVEDDGGKDVSALDEAGRQIDRIEKVVTHVALRRAASDDDAV
ncbi:hypothetical protein ASA1KI_15620 [Opitutales bacterium ASA1]|nr:hypothetical protein ASA1KI_15620 [Opitutales bacterium ASA1]